MSKGKRFVIADVHGNLKTLKSLISRFNIREDDQVFFLGDYINKGPDSKGVIDYIIQLKKQYKVVCLKGNHEEMYEKASADPYQLKNNNGAFSPKYQQFWDELKWYVELEDAFLVHASINFKADNPFADKKCMLWKAHRSIYDKNLAGKRVIRGHSTKPIQQIKEAINRRDQVIPLDNGAERNTDSYRYLCALELNSFKLILQTWMG